MNKRRRAMKRTIGMVGISLFLVSMVLAGCASMAPVQKTKLSTSDLSALTGTWQGWTTFNSFSSTPIMTTIEITNSAVPLQGKVMFPNVPAGAAAALPGVFTTAGSNVLEFLTGRITDQGTLIAGNGSNFVEFNYYAGTKPKLDGWFFYNGARGTLSVSK
jgi:hypothetical protein